MCLLGFVTLAGRKAKALSAPLTASLHQWQQELIGDIDRDFLLQGIQFGFHILTPQEHTQPVLCDNYKSATGAEYRKLVEEQLSKEISLGHYVLCDSAPMIVSSLGAIPKKSGGVRLIHDCSRPTGVSVNSYASKHSFKYVTVDTAVRQLPPGGWMAKVDLSSAYRSVPVHPSCYEYLGLQWTWHGNRKPSYFVDTRLPFGGTECPEKFQRLSNAVTRMMGRRGYEVISYLDDFLVLAADKRQCADAYNELLRLLQSLGFTINWDKAVPPSQVLTFLGVKINSITRTLSLPADKLAEIKSSLHAWAGKKKATKRQLQQLIGQLSWAARMVKIGRAFLRRLLSAMCSLKAKHHHVRLSSDARADIDWWVRFITPFNGTIHISSVPEPTTYLTSDACNIGGAAVCNQDWYYANWAIDFPDYQDVHINIKELLSILLALRRWKHLWKGTHVVVFTDSECVMHMINNCSTKNPLAMDLIRELCLICVSNDCHLSAKHICGAHNVVSDFLSRLTSHLNWQAALPALHLKRGDLHCHISSKSLQHLETLHGRCH